MHPYRAVDPAADSSLPPAGRKSALAFFGVLLALFPPALLAQYAHPVAGLAATQLFAFLVPSLVATAGSNLRLVPYLRLARPRPVLLVLGALAGGAASLGAAAIMALTERALPRTLVERYDLSHLFEGPATVQAALIVVAAALAPACEEITFRGYVQSTLALRRRPAGAIVTGAFLFAALHLDPVRFPALLLLGIAFGWMTWRTGSVWPAIAAHAANNALAAALFVAAGPPRDEARPEITAALVLLAVGAGALALLLLAIDSAAPETAAVAGAVVLRDPASPSIRFAPGRVPRPLAAIAMGGAMVLAALASAGLARGLTRGP